MNREEFEKLLDELDGNSVSTLKEKNSRYSSPDDTLHNFNSGADIMGGTPAQACWGYLTKHLVALRDMVERNDFRNREDFLEKCQDSINYIRFLWCIGNEERKNYVQCEESTVTQPEVTLHVGDNPVRTLELTPREERPIMSYDDIQKIPELTDEAIKKYY